MLSQGTYDCLQWLCYRDILAGCGVDKRRSAPSAQIQNAYSEPSCILLESAYPVYVLCLAAGSHPMHWGNGPTTTQGTDGLGSCLTALLLPLLLRKNSGKAEPELQRERRMQTASQLRSWTPSVLLDLVPRFALLLSLSDVVL